MTTAIHAPRPWYAGRSNRGPLLPGGLLNHSEYILWVWLKGKARDGQVIVDLDRLARTLGWSRRWTQRIKRGVILKGCLRETSRFNAIGRQLPSGFEVLKNEQPTGGGRVACTPPQVLSTTQKAKDIEPAAARPAPPHRSPNRNIVNSSRIARRFCEERRITHPWYRRNITQRIEALLNTGHEEAAIVAQLDREREAAAPPRKILRRQMLERVRMAARAGVGYNPCSTWPPAPPAEAEEEKGQATPRVWRTPAQLKAAEERHAESRRRWVWFDERIQTDGEVRVEGRMCRTDEDILAVSRWLMPRNQLNSPAAAAFRPRR